MADLQRSLSLPGLPHRIEGFDISNIQGTEAVGSMVVWEAGGMKKDDYKRYRIRTVPGADDYAMMAEVLRRRYGKALEESTPLPDLVMLDGGRGQLNVGIRVLEELGLDFVPIVSLAKREEEVYHPESLHPLVLDPASPALHALQRIRDEAHRFAITYHKKLRQRRTLQSVLDQIPGVGPTIRTSLLRHARLGPEGARGLGRRAGGGPQGDAEAGPAHPRVLPPGARGGRRSRSETRRPARRSGRVGSPASREARPAGARRDRRRGRGRRDRRPPHGAARRGRRPAGWSRSRRGSRPSGSSASSWWPPSAG